MPKGVAVTHRNVVRLLESREDDLGAVAGQVWSQSHSLAFDVSVWEMWGACYTAADWWWYPSRWRGRPRICTPLLVTEQVSVLSQTPSAFYALQTADSLQPDLSQQLKLQVVVFAGRPLSRNVFSPG